MATDHPAMTADASDLLHDLDTTDWSTVRDAVESAGGWLRSRQTDEATRSAIAERLLQLAAHDKWEIRKAVAHAALHLRHDAFHGLIAHVVADDNAWVRDAANQTLRRRSDLTRADLHGEGNGDVLMGMLAGLEARHGSRARQAALRVADHLHHRFVREAYHEIVRVIAPLDASLLNLEKQIAGNGASEQMLAQVRKAQARTRMITEFLENLRALTVDSDVRFGPEPLVALIQEAVELAIGDQDLCTEEIDFVYEVEDGLCIDASRSHLMQALLNLFVNAVEACAGTERRGRIFVAAARRSASLVSITVSDNGCGMSAEGLRDCCLLYSSGKPSGMGFGLPLARKIVEVVHRGTLSVASTEGEGTSVTLLLPIEQAARQE